jgi:hypothetical protein
VLSSGSSLANNSELDHDNNIRSIKVLLVLGNKWPKGFILEIDKELLRKNNCISETKYSIELTLHLVCGPLKAYC